MKLEDAKEPQNMFKPNLSKISKGRFKLKEQKNDCNWTQIHNHLVRKRTLNHLAKLAK